MTSTIQRADTASFLQDAFDCFSNESITAAIQANDLTIEYDIAPSHREVEENKFDPTSYWVYQIAKVDPVLKEKATKKVYSLIAAKVHRGIPDGHIFADLEHTIEFMGISGKRPLKTFEKMISNVRDWIYYSSCEAAFYNALGWVYEGKKSRRLQKENKRLHPAIIILVALQQAKDINQHGLMSLGYTEQLSSILLTEKIEGKHLTRKYEAYAKNEHVSYLKGVRHGLATRVGLKNYEGVLTAEDKLMALEAIVEFFVDSEVKELLKQVLQALVDMDGKPRYDNCDFSNKVSDLIEAFKKIALAVGEDQRAERLIESVEWAKVVEQRTQERNARITATLNSGFGIVAQPYANSNVAVLEAPVEAPEIAVEELETITGIPATAPVFKPGKTLSEHSANLKAYTEARREYNMLYLMNGMDW